MNFTRIARLLGGFALFFAVVQLVPLGMALCEAPTRFETVSGFAAGFGIGLAVSALLLLAGRSADVEFHRKESLAVVGFAWFLAAALGAIPFVWSGTLSSVIDAGFETVSGLTTTGASVFGSGDNAAISSLPHSILLWRAILHFVGGIGIILIFIVLLPAMGVTGKNLLASEQVGVSTEVSQPRLREQGRALFKIYLGLTFLCGLAYWIAGMGIFDAICHAFATLATGGFSTQDHSLADFGSLPIELVCIAFMFLAGCNFAWYVTLLRSRGRDAPRVLQSPELRCYAGLTLGLVVVVAVSLWLRGDAVADVGGVRDYADLGTCLRDAAFNTVSLITSTGFASANFQVWPRLAVVAFLLCMLIGSCTGSTAGGFKVLRILVSVKLAAFHLRRFVRPKSVERLKLGGDIVPDPIVSGILAVLVLWLATLAVGTVVFALDSRLDFLSCLSASVSMLGCTGPALTAVQAVGEGPFSLANPATFTIANSGALDLGPFGGYGALPPGIKLWCCVQMVFGRLEIVAPLVLFVPGFWRR